MPARGMLLKGRPKSFKGRFWTELKDGLLKLNLKNISLLQDLKRVR